jgi:hypothetical protein
MAFSAYANNSGRYSWRHSYESDAHQCRQGSRGARGNRHCYSSENDGLFIEEQGNYFYSSVNAINISGTSETVISLMFFLEMAYLLDSILIFLLSH